MDLNAIKPDQRLSGATSDETFTVVKVDRTGPDACLVVLRSADGVLSERVISRVDAEAYSPAKLVGRTFDADPVDFRLAAEAQRISLAGAWDPMIAVATSAIDPLPHQIDAVYNELLPRVPLRFLLADDPGAGKTIMAGLYIKELILRGDVQRCLVVAPGGLVEQWQDELHLRFGLWFDILTRDMVESTAGMTVLERHPLLIARMDQMARNEEWLGLVRDADWDLIVVDEAHRMSARWWSGEVNKSRRFELGELLSQRGRHFLLMTATPHSGKDDDFRLFLTLLDPDRFAGRGIARSADTGVVQE